MPRADWRTNATPIASVWAGYRNYCDCLVALVWPTPLTQHSGHPPLAGAWASIPRRRILRRARMPRADWRTNATPIASDWAGHRQNYDRLVAFVRPTPLTQHSGHPPLAGACASIPRPRISPRPRMPRADWRTNATPIASVWAGYRNYCDCLVALVCPTPLTQHSGHLPLAGPCASIPRPRILRRPRMPRADWRTNASRSPAPTGGSVGLVLITRSPFVLPVRLVATWAVWAADAATPPPSVVCTPPRNPFSRPPRACDRGRRLALPPLHSGQRPLRHWCRVLCGVDVMGYRPPDGCG